MMWDDDKQLLDALREEIDGPAPAVRTQLSDIVSRGLRRRRLRQVSSIAAALVVVVGVGVVAMTVGGNSTLSNEPAQTSNTVPTSVPLTTDWGRANLPTLTPVMTWTPRRGQPPIPGVPETGIPVCAAGYVDPGLDPRSAELSRGEQDRLMAALREVAGPAEVSDLVAEKGDRGEPVYWADITDSVGAGSVWIWPEITPASPLATADHEAFSENNCLPPKRVVRPDGAVIQVYAIRAENTDATQSLRVYFPDGRKYVVLVHNYKAKGRGEMGQIIVTRPGPALTEHQLAKLGEALVS